MDPNKHHAEKACIITAAIVAGILVCLSISVEIVPSSKQVNVGSWFSPVYEQQPTAEPSISHRSGFFLAIAALIGIASSFIYVTFAARAARALISLRSWAYQGTVERPKDDVILIIGAFWPFTLFCGALIYTFIGIIHRSFQ